MSSSLPAADGHSCRRGIRENMSRRNPFAIRQLLMFYMIVSLLPDMLCASTLDLTDQAFLMGRGQPNMSYLTR